MTLETLTEFFFWSSVINIGCMTFAFIALAAMPDLVYAAHKSFFKRMTRETFDSVTYAGMSFYKMCTFLFFIIPYIALRIIG